jgi:hypothetical protein
MGLLDKARKASAIQDIVLSGSTKAPDGTWVRTRKEYKAAEARAKKSKSGKRAAKR